MPNLLSNRMLIFRKQKGFTLVEILVTIAAMGVLLTVALPSFQSYVARARYGELIQASLPYKKGIGACFQITGNLFNCQAGQNGVPQNILNSNTTLARYIITASGFIYVFPNNTNDFQTFSDYYWLRPTVTNGVITWQYGGPGFTKGYITQ